MQQGRRNGQAVRRAKTIAVSESGDNFGGNHSGENDNKNISLICRPFSGFMVASAEVWAENGSAGATPASTPSSVKLSIKSDYAARAVLWLSQHYTEGVARTVEEMASAQNIPANYLVQILLELKSAQIVKSQRGKEGGYMLARAPAEISFGDVLRCIHGEVFDSPALGHAATPPELRRAWEQVRDAVNRTAEAITFQQLLEAGAGKEKMYYI